VITHRPDSDAEVKECGDHVCLPDSTPYSFSKELGEWSYYKFEFRGEEGQTKRREEK